MFRAEFSLTEPIPLQAVILTQPKSTITVWLALVTNTWPLTQRVLPPWPLTSSRKTSAQWCCVITTPNWPIRLGDSWRWELQTYTLTHSILVISSTVICWRSPFVIFKGCQVYLVAFILFLIENPVNNVDPDRRHIMWRLTHYVASDLGLHSLSLILLTLLRFPGKNGLIQSVPLPMIKHHV